MATGIDSIFSLHERALQVHGQRMELIASNLANTDTPGFKARDIDFRQVLSSVSQSGGSGIQTTHVRHMAPGGEINGPNKQYRTPVQPSLDGNTVDSNMEKTALAEASMRYESTLTFLGRKIAGLKAALRIQ